MAAVKVLYLNGDSQNVQGCATVGSLMAHVAMLQRRFATDVTLLCTETSKDLTESRKEAPPQTVSVVFKVAVDRPSESDLRLTLFLHAEREDVATCERALLMLRTYCGWFCPFDFLLSAIHTSSAKDHKRLVRTLVRAGIDGAAALKYSARYAIQDTACRAIKLLFAAGVCPNTVLHGEDSALMVAARCLRKRVVVLLLSGRADVNYTDQHGKTPILQVCFEARSKDSLGRRKRRKDVAEVLLHYGADANHSSESDGFTALHRASEVRHGGLAEMLLSHGAQADHVTGQNDETALMRLSRKGGDGHLHLAGLLLARGAKANCAAKNGLTALMIACSAGRENLVKELVAYGARINTEMLKKATIKGRLGMVRILLCYDTQVNSSTTPNWIALIEAVLQERKDVVEQLLSDGTNVNETNSWGMTALMAASSGKNDEIVTILLSHGARINHGDKYGSNALIVASCCGRKNVVKLLLSHGAQVNREDQDGLTAIEWARQRNHKGVVKMILAHGERASRGTGLASGRNEKKQGLRGTLGSKRVKKSATKKASLSTSAVKNDKKKSNDSISAVKKYDKKQCGPSITQIKTAKKNSEDNVSTRTSTRKRVKKSARKKTGLRTSAVTKNDKKKSNSITSAAKKTDKNSSPSTALSKQVKKSGTKKTSSSASASKKAKEKNAAKASGKKTYDVKNGCPEKDKGRDEGRPRSSADKKTQESVEEKGEENNIRRDAAAQEDERERCLSRKHL